MAKYINNKTFDEIEIGDSASIQHKLTQRDIQLFAIMSGDVNPAHLDPDYAKSDLFHKIVAHGMWGGALISTVLGTRLPGPGTIYLSQSFKFIRPVALGDTVTARVKVTGKDDQKHHVTLDCVCLNQEDKEVIIGEAVVLAPTEKVHRQNTRLPRITFEESVDHHHNNIIKLVKGLKPLVTAVVHPVDSLSLKGALAAAEAGIIEAILVGPEEKIRNVAEQEKLDLSKYQIISTLHSHEAAARAVQLAREGKVESIMKGKIHTDELIKAALDPQTGIRTDRRMSHISMMSIPSFPRPLFITDAAINIFPTLTEKKDIIQNANDLFNAIGFGIPRVAILSAEEDVNEKIPSTVHAAALCKMAERGKITGGLLDGPLSFDLALSEDAANVKGIHSAVSGKADILVVPDLESGNMLIKQLALLSEATMAGLVLGSTVPIILTSRSSNELSRLSSSALALLYCRKHKKIKKL